MEKCIVKMRFPKNCVSCQVITYFDNENCVCPIARVWMLYDEIKNETSRPDWCPIEQEIVPCGECVHAEAAKRGMCLYDSNICVGGERKEKKDEYN